MSHLNSFITIPYSRSWSNMIAYGQYLWAPNEHSLAYAYHMQVATDEQEGEGESVIMPENELQPVANHGNVQISPVDLSGDRLKPMKMQCRKLFVSMSSITKDQVASIIDHTLLKVVFYRLSPHFQAFATEDDIIALCRDAHQYKFASVCVNPMYSSFLQMMLQLCPNCRQNIEISPISCESLYGSWFPSGKQFHGQAIFTSLNTRKQGV